MSVKVDPPKYWMGFYGCSRELVRLCTSKVEPGPMGHRRPKVNQELECPACGYTHKVKISWRRPIKPSERERADMTV